jgi:hypothetical protein
MRAGQCVPRPDRSSSTRPLFTGTIKCRWITSWGGGGLADEKRETILVACSKCDLQAFSRDDLIATHGAYYPMLNLLDQLAAPDCPRLDSTWDRCGVHYVEPIKGGCGL